ncbi:MAG: hypothetical protein WCF23_08010 [Candidatus Nitrosopolaris sp.]
MAIVRLTKIMSDVDLSKNDRGISGTSDRECLYQEYSEHIKEKHYSSLPRPAIKLLKGSISQIRCPLMMLSVFGLEISKHRLPIWVPIKNHTLWHLLVLLSIATLAQEIDI